MISEIENILDTFNSVRLEEMDKVRLMDRVDTKYLIPVNRIPYLLNIMLGRYRILEINNRRISSYSTIYLDTPDHFFFNQHVTGRSERMKVRFRRYDSTGITFLEVKKKTKKGRTVKRRIENSPAGDTFNKSAIEFIDAHVNLNSNELRPVLTNNFKRITLTGFNIPERITIDLDLSFTSTDGRSVDLPLISIVELKSEGVASRSPFSRIIKQVSAYPTGFSKYCIGCALLYDLPMKSILKPKILLLNRIENEYNGSLSA